MSWKIAAALAVGLAVSGSAWGHVDWPWAHIGRGGWVRWDAHDPMFRDPWGRMHSRMPWVEPHNVRVPGDLLDVGALIGKVDGHVVSTCVEEEPDRWVHLVRDHFRGDRDPWIAQTRCGRGAGLLERAVRNLESAARMPPGPRRTQRGEEIAVSIQCAAAAIPLTDWDVPSHVAARCGEGPEAVGHYDSAVWSASDPFRERLCDLARTHRDDGAAFQLDGHTDADDVRGPIAGPAGVVDTNHALGLARAHDARAALVGCGVAPERIAIASFADARPPLGGGNPRRVEVRVLPR